MEEFEFIMALIILVIITIVNFTFTKATIIQLKYASLAFYFPTNLPLILYISEINL